MLVREVARPNAGVEAFAGFIDIDLMASVPTIWARPFLRSLTLPVSDSGRLSKLAKAGCELS